MSHDVERALLTRLRDLPKIARMWGSPEELECVALHLSHLVLSLRSPSWTLEQTFERWRSLGAPFATDADQHAHMRTRLWGAHEDTARAQVIRGFAVVWASLDRVNERESVVGPWIETILDSPQRVGTPDRLNMVLFTLMGFVAADPHTFVRVLGIERERIGGYSLRPLTVVGPPGPIEASLVFAGAFSSWPAVTEGVRAMVSALESQAP